MMLNITIKAGRYGIMKYPCQINSLHIIRETGGSGRGDETGIGTK